MMEPVARISKSFGREGELIATLYASFPDTFDPAADPLFATVDGLVVPLYCDRFERRGRSSALLRFADLDTERRAAMLLGLELSAEQQGETADSDEFYMEDLIGFRVTAAGRKGEIVDYYDSEANPLFEIELTDADGARRRALVPAAEEFFARIDFERQTVKLVLPEGLLDL